MNSETAYEEIEYIVLDFCKKFGRQDKYVKEILAVLKQDLETLGLIKKHYKMNGFDELIPIYLSDEDENDFNQIEEWLENGK